MPRHAFDLSPGYVGECRRRAKPTASVECLTADGEELPFPMQVSTPYGVTRFCITSTRQSRPGTKRVLEAGRGRGVLRTVGREPAFELRPACVPPYPGKTPPRINSR